MNTFQLVDWRKDKGKVEDHKTYLDVPALKVNTVLRPLFSTFIDGNNFGNKSGLFFRSYGIT